jgi:hypothetical protein
MLAVSAPVIAGRTGVVETLTKLGDEGLGAMSFGAFVVEVGADSTFPTAALGFGVIGDPEILIDDVLAASIPASPDPRLVADTCGDAGDTAKVPLSREAIARATLLPELSEPLASA